MWVEVKIVTIVKTIVSTLWRCTLTADTNFTMKLIILHASERVKDSVSVWVGVFNHLVQIAQQNASNVSVFQNFWIEFCITAGI